MDSCVHEFYKSFRKTWFRFLAFFLSVILFLSFVRLSTNGFEKNLLSNTMIKSTNKLIKSSAQSVTLCVLPDSTPTQAERIVERVNSDSGISIIIKSLVELQFSHGLRISEALNLSNSDLLSMHRIRIKSLKGSIQRIIVFNDSHGYFDFCRKTGSKPFDGLSRFTVYRIYKKLNIQYLNSDSAYLSVTHAPRHIVASELQKLDKNNDFTSDFLRHKSNKSLEHYKI
jgi:integrase